MRITEIDTRLIRIAPSIKISDSIQSISHWEWIITTVRTDAGQVGTGWSYTLGIGGTAVRAIISDYLTPILLRSHAGAIEQIWERCWRELHANGSGGFTTLALAPIDIALWDIRAKAAGRPLFEIMGGARQRIPAYGSGINMHLEGEPLADQMRGFLEAGYRAVKMKVGRDDPAEDVERVAIVRKTIGPAVRLLLDANQKWAAGEAVRRMAMLECFDPYWIEEPVLADDIPGHTRVRAALKTPVALGETLFTRYQFADYIRADAVDIVQPDVPRVGGFTEWLKIAKLAEAHNLPVAPHFAVELSVHGLCAVPNGLILEDLQGGSLTDLGLLAEPWRVVDGYGVPPKQPGHGFVFDEAALARHEVRGRPDNVTATRM